MVGAQLPSMQETGVSRRAVNWGIKKFMMTCLISNPEESTSTKHFSQSNLLRHTALHRSCPEGVDLENGAIAILV